jgi:hypothetical protein
MPSCVVTAVSIGTVSFISSARRNSAPLTRREAAPPKPLSSATICGIAVIFTVRAIQSPIAVPTTIPAAMVPYDRIARSSIVMTIARSIPAPEIRLPSRAVSGLPSRLSPRMKRTAATR